MDIWLFHGLDQSYSGRVPGPGPLGKAWPEERDLARSHDHAHGRVFEDENASIIVAEAALNKLRK